MGARPLGGCLGLVSAATIRPFVDALGRCSALAQGAQATRLGRPGQLLLVMAMSTSVSLLQRGGGLWWSRWVLGPPGSPRGGQLISISQFRRWPNWVSERPMGHPLPWAGMGAPSSGAFSHTGA